MIGGGTSPTPPILDNPDVVDVYSDFNGNDDIDDDDVNVNDDLKKKDVDGDDDLDEDDVNDDYEVDDDNRYSYSYS